MLRMKWFAAALVAAAATLVPAAQDGAGGTLHLGSAGTSARASVSSNDAANALALQSDGKFVAAGGDSFHFALARYRPNGRLDLAFGVGGRVVTDIAGSDFDRVDAVAIQGNGKLVAAGWSFYPDQGAWPVLARYSRDGRLDRTFGRNGIVQKYFGFVEPGSYSVAAHAVAIQRDGKIVAAGESGGNDQFCTAAPCAPASSQFALARFLPSGHLDPGFGSGGKVTTDAGPQPIDVANALAVQRDGKLVLAGYTGDAPGSPYRKGDFALARYLRDGQLDPTFGNGGKVVTGFGPTAVAEAEAVALQRDGRIVAAGRSCALPHTRTSCQLAVARYLPDGSLDPSFAGGTVLLRFGSAEYNEASAVAIQRDGRIVVAGHSGKSTRRPSRFALARFLPNGHLDRSFGAGGKVLTQIRRGRFDSAAALILARRGKILAAGQSGPGDLPGRPGDFALARYRRNGRLDRTFGKAGKLLTDFSSVDR